MNYECCSDLIQAIEAENLPKTYATRKLTEFYAKARFGIDDKKFEKRVKSTFDSCLYLIKIKRRHDPQVT